MLPAEMSPGIRSLKEADFQQGSVQAGEEYSYNKEAPK